MIARPDSTTLCAMSKDSVGFFAPRRTRRLAALLPLVLCACHLLRPAKTPMNFELHPSPATDGDVLVVLLPGIESVAADFELHGFPERIQAALPGADVLAVDAHFAYYWQDSLVTRLHEDVLRPRLERYEQVWLLGISLGKLPRGHAIPRRGAAFARPARPPRGAAGDPPSPPPKRPPR